MRAGPKASPVGLRGPSRWVFNKAPDRNNNNKSRFNWRRGFFSAHMSKVPTSRASFLLRFIFLWLTYTCVCVCVCVRAAAAFLEQTATKRVRGMLTNQSSTRLNSTRSGGAARPNYAQRAPRTRRNYAAVPSGKKRITNELAWPL